MGKLDFIPTVPVLKEIVASLPFVGRDTPNLNVLVEASLRPYRYSDAAEFSLATLSSKFQSEMGTPMTVRDFSYLYAARKTHEFRTGNIEGIIAAGRLIQQNNYIQAYAKRNALSGLETSPNNYIESGRVAPEDVTDLAKSLHIKQRIGPRGMPIFNLVAGNVDNPRAAALAEKILNADAKLIAADERKKELIAAKLEKDPAYIPTAAELSSLEFKMPNGAVLSGRGILEIKQRLTNVFNQTAGVWINPTNGNKVEFTFDGKKQPDEYVAALQWGEGWNDTQAAVISNIIDSSSVPGPEGFVHTGGEFFRSTIFDFLRETFRNMR